MTVCKAEYESVCNPSSRDLARPRARTCMLSQNDSLECIDGTYSASCFLLYALLGALPGERFGGLRRAFVPCRLSAPRPRLYQATASLPVLALLWLSISCLLSCPNTLHPPHLPPSSPSSPFSRSPFPCSPPYFQTSSGADPTDDPRP